MPTAVTSLTLLHVGFGNHTTATAQPLKKRTCQQLPAPSAPLGNHLSRAGEKEISLVCVYVCVSLCECLLDCVCFILVSLINVINSFTWRPGHHSPILCQAQLNSENRRINRERLCSSAALCWLLNTAVPCCSSYCNNFLFFSHCTNWLWSLSDCRATCNLQEVLFFDAVKPKDP